MNKKVVLSCAALVVAGILLYSHWRDRHPLPGETYFYDLSEEKLFAGPLVALPPIQGINDLERDAVRALVISPSGDPSDKSDRKIAYLETYSEIFKQQVESRRRGDVPAEGAWKIGRGAANAHTFVRRLTETKWYPKTSPEATKIIGEWRVMGSDGKYPVKCIP